MPIKLADPLETVNYNELNVYSNTNIAEADTFFVYNSSVSEPQRLTWNKLRGIISLMAPHYTITVGDIEYWFTGTGSGNTENIDLTPAFNSYIKTDGSVQMVGSYLPTLPKQVITLDYLNARNAYSFQYKGGQTIGGYLDLLPTMLTAYLLADGTRLLPDDYTPTQPKSIATKDYVTSVSGAYVKLDGTTALTGNLNLATNTIINLGNPVNSTDAVPKNYVDNLNITNYKLDGSALPTASLNMNANKITNLATPTVPTDATPRSYVDMLNATNYKLDGTNLPSATLNMNNNKITGLAPATVNTDAVNKLQMDTSDNLRLKLDGTSLPTANIPMNNFKLTGLSAGTSSGDSLRFDEFATSPKVRLKDEPSYTGLNIPLTAAPVNILTGLAPSTPNAFLTGGKIQPLNKPTELSIQLLLTGNFTVGALLPAALIQLVLSNGVTSKTKRVVLGTATGTNVVLCYEVFPYEIDVGGAAFTNGITVTASIINGGGGTNNITAISAVLRQYNV